MNGYWANEIKRPCFEGLSSTIRTDVLIIGGGIAGILCARLLRDAGIDCVLTEADTICGGVTGNTTAKITVQHGLIYSRIYREYGKEAAKMYYEANRWALEKYRFYAENIKCDFKNVDSYIYSTHGKAPLERELRVLSEIGCPADMVQDLPLPFATDGAICVKDQAQFDPLRFAFALCADLPVFEHTTVRELVGTVARTDHGSIVANKIIVATHFPFLNKHGAYFLKLYQRRSYVLALENAQTVDGLYQDEARDGLTFRSHGSLLLLGGMGHRTGKKGGGYAALREFAAKYYPHATEKAHFATQDCMTLDGIPYVGRYGGRTKNLYVATGFNKWGMTSAMAAAITLCDIIRGEKSPYAELFSPKRTVFHGQLAANALEATVNLLRPGARRCPHMGCALRWNPQEHTFDCPCHGSRFTKDGHLIDNPATGDLKK